MPYLGPKPVNVRSASSLIVDGDLTADTNTLFVDASANKVGIGNAAPSDKLVVQDDSTNIQPILVLKNDNTTDDNGMSIDFSGKDTSSNNITYGRIDLKIPNHATEKSDMRFYTRNDSGVFTTQLQLTKDENAVFAGGISMNGETGAANILDDYEEGTWTPVVNGENQVGSNSSNVYVKIGRLVFVCVDMTLSVTSGSNDAIAGLPFAPAVSYTGTFTVGYHNDNSTSNPIVGIASPTGGIILYTGSTNKASFDNNERIIISGTYYTTS